MTVRPPGSTQRLLPENAWPARGSGQVSDPRAPWVRRKERVPSPRVSRGPPQGSRALLRTAPHPATAHLRGRLGLHFTSVVPACAHECACARASRSGSSSDKAPSAGGPGVRGAPGRRAARDWRWGGAERRRREQSCAAALSWPGRS